MVYSFIIPPQTISSIQEQLNILEKCLNDPNAENEATTQILELAKKKHLSLGQLQGELGNVIYKLHQLIQLAEEFNKKLAHNEIGVLLFVRLNFLLKEIVDQNWEFFPEKDGRETLTEITATAINLYRVIQSKTNSSNLNKDTNYIFIETLKHLIPSLIKTSLQVNALSEAEINALKLGNITPQESETMLTFLASKEKWDSVYKNLA